MTPIASEERIELLDIARGAALFGILASNMRAFNSPLAAYFDHSLMWTGTADRAVQALIDFFISGKFISIFSFLFGVGFAVQMDRAAARGTDPRRFYRRRLAVLLAFGLLHGFLIWWGDILTVYALLGFLLLAFRNSSQKKILRWAAIFYLWPVAVTGLLTLATVAGAPMPPAERTTQQELERIILVYSQGSYGAILRQHLNELGFSAAGFIFFYPRVLGLFLVGLWVYRAGIIREIGQRQEMLRRCRNWGMVIGVLGNGAMVAIELLLHPNPTAMTIPTFLYGLAGSIGVPAMSLFYLSAVALAYQRAEWQSRLRPFASIGRTPLTNYLAQSVICTFLYNSWGLGLYGRVGPMWGLLPTVGIYAAQLAASVWYTQRFRYGPVEWLWRRLTYGRLRPEISDAVSAP